MATRLRRARLARRDRRAAARAPARRRPRPRAPAPRGARAALRRASGAARACSSCARNGTACTRASRDPERPPTPSSTASLVAVGRTGRGGEIAAERAGAPRRRARLPGRRREAAHEAAAHLRDRRRHRAAAARAPRDAPGQGRGGGDRGPAGGLRAGGRPERSPTPTPRWRGRGSARRRRRRRAWRSRRPCSPGARAAARSVSCAARGPTRSCCSSRAAVGSSGRASSASHAGDLIAEAVLALELGADAEDLALSIHPHPTLSETLGLAAELAAGTITDLLPARRKPR